MKNNKGVTLTILIITIIVMILILGITISTADTLFRNTQKNRLKTNMYLIKARAETLLENYLFENDVSNIDTNTNYRTQLGGDNCDPNYISLVGFYEGDKKIYRIWTKETLKNQGIDTSNIANDNFVIEYDLISETVDIGSISGYSDGKGNTYHKLSELENN